MVWPKSKKKNKRNKGGELEHGTILKTVGCGGWGEVGVLERAEGDSGLPYPEPEVPEEKCGTHIKGAIASCRIQREIIGSKYKKKTVKQN